VSVGFRPNLVTTSEIRGCEEGLGMPRLNLAQASYPRSVKMSTRLRTFVEKVAHLRRVYKCGLLLSVQGIELQPQRERISMKMSQPVKDDGYSCSEQNLLSLRNSS
jgi:hypothetical protein